MMTSPIFLAFDYSSFVGDTCNGQEFSCRAAAAVTPNTNRNAAKATHPSKEPSTERSAATTR